MILKPNRFRERQYKIYRNKLNHLIRNAKRIYYETKFEVTKSDLKQTWNLINGVFNKGKVKPSLPSSFNLNTEVVTDPLAIANGFVSILLILVQIWPKKNQLIVIVLFSPSYRS